MLHVIWIIVVKQIKNFYKHSIIREKNVFLNSHSNVLISTLIHAFPVSIIYNKLEWTFRYETFEMRKSIGYICIYFNKLVLR